DQASKFVFWRLIADRVGYLRAASIIWISGAWIRGARHIYQKPMGDLPMMGETRTGLGYDKDGQSVRHTSVIRRSSEGGKPRLEQASTEESSTAPPPRNHLFAVKKAFEKTWRAQRD